MGAVALGPGVVLYGSPRIRLEIIDASGPGAPGRDSDIERTTVAVTCGCFRAEWSDEARPDHILNPPKPVLAPRQTRQQEQKRTGSVDRFRGGGLSAG